jgi:PP-loop superfamily ATP-utilizing enzyme
MYFDLLLSRIEEMNENDSVRCYLCIMELQSYYKKVKCGKI